MCAAESRLGTLPGPGMFESPPHGKESAGCDPQTQTRADNDSLSSVRQSHWRAGAVLGNQHWAAADWKVSDGGNTRPHGLEQNLRF